MSVVNTVPRADAFAEGAGVGYRYYVVGLLLASNVIGSIDRQIVNILAEPIKLDLALSDWQLGIITGLAFALFYTIMGLPLARLADRWHRGRLISASMALWSAFTALCAISQSFVQLAVFRVFVGVGEAGSAPAAHSYITDAVAKTKRAMSLSIYALGLPLGKLLGLGLGGLLAQHFGWRNVLLMSGIPGIVLAVVMWLTFREIRSKDRSQAAPAGMRLGAVLAALKGKRSYWYNALGMAGTAFTLTALQNFAAPFFLRNHHDSLAELAKFWGGALHIDLAPIGFLGIALGLATGAAGTAGILTGGVLADRLGRVDERGYLVAPALSAFLSAPIFVAACLAPSAGTALLLWAMGAFLVMLPNGPAFAVVQSVAPRQGRAMAAAILLFILNLFGSGFGPLIAGTISDLLNHGWGLGPNEGLRYALVAMTLFAFLASACFWSARRHILSDLEH